MLTSAAAPPAPALPLGPAGDPGATGPQKGTHVLRPHLGITAAGIAALALSPLALVLPAQAAPHPAAAPTAAAAASSSRPDPSFGPAQRKAAVAGEAVADAKRTWIHARYFWVLLPFLLLIVGVMVLVSFLGS